jgi:hypothetical protein
MKNTDIKFATSQTLLVVGSIILSISGRWWFFIGLTLVMVSGLFSLRRDTRPMSLLGWIVRTLLFIGCILFLVWLSSFGTKPPPVAALVGVWFGCSIEEFNTWRLSRRLT